MKNQNFYMRVISLLLVILAVLFYSSSMKAQANEKEIAALTDKVDTLQEQQNELLSALETSYVNRMQDQAASAGSGSSDADTTGDDKTTDTSTLPHPKTAKTICTNLCPATKRCVFCCNRTN